MGSLSCREPTSRMQCDRSGHYVKGSQSLRASIIRDFLGIALRARPDASRFELFYVRPGNADAADQAMRNHAVQYSSEPDYGWYRLRREWPSVYESHVEILPWKRGSHSASKLPAVLQKLYLNGSLKPSLVVDGFERRRSAWWRGPVELHRRRSLFLQPSDHTSRFGGREERIREVAGHWEMQFSTGRGRMGGIMDLHRDGNDVTGTWSGPMGNDQAVTGVPGETGYAELAPRRGLAQGNRQRKARSGPRLSCRLDRWQLRQGTDACGWAYRTEPGWRRA